MIKSLLFIAMSIVMLVGCSDNSSEQEKETGDHVWKQQTDMIDKAKDVENILQDAADKQQQQLNEQTH